MTVQGPTRPAAVTVHQLSKTFTRRGREVRALEQASLDIAPSEFVALIGPSGCGKSTLLKAIAGLLSPTAGHIEIDGERVTDPHASASLCFQKPTLLRWRTVLNNVLLPLAIAGEVDQESVQRARSLLALMGLSDFENHYPRELSGGMEQRAAIARALVRRPSLLLMDEPFGALDEFTREDLNDELLRVWSQEPKTLVFVTHSISEAVFLADRVVVMSARPSRITAEIRIRLPRPRLPELRSDPEFFKVISEVRAVLDQAHARGDVVTPGTRSAS